MSKIKSVVHIAFKDITKHIKESNTKVVDERGDVWTVTPNRLYTKETIKLNHELKIHALNKQNNIINLTKKDIIYQKYGGLCYYSGRPLGDDWQIDHLTPKVNKGSNDISNLVPAISIINHYKRCLNIEDFRTRLLTLHLRLKKLPKNPKKEKSKKKILYLKQVAELFNITESNPFDGTFYFETL